MTRVSDHGALQDEYILDILDAVSADTGRKFDQSRVARLSRPGFKADVADAFEVFLVPGRRKADDAVLSLSPPAFPEAVAGAVSRTKALAGGLPERLAETVLLPEYQGRYSGRSFALYPRLLPVSGNRAFGYLQKRMLRRPVTEWAGCLARASRSELTDDAEIARRFLEPLGRLSEESGASDELRAAARSAAEAFLHGRLRPVTVIQHGDFWLGNILLRHIWPLRRGRDYPFMIIDWGAVNRQGYPVVDLMRFLGSATRNAGFRAAALDRYRASAGLDRAAVLPHLCAGIGWLGMHRNQFPLSRYLESSERLFRMTRTVLNASPGRSRIT